MARILAAFFLFSLNCFAGNSWQGCGPKDQQWSVSVKTIKDFQLPMDASHSTIVFINEIPSFNQQKVGVDGEWKAATKKNTYAAFQVLPGQHQICLATGSHALARIPLTTEAGKAYFLDHPLRFFEREELEVMSADSGRGQLASLKVSLSHPKN